MGPPWVVSAPAQAAGIAALREQDYVARVRALIRAERPHLAEGLAALGCEVIPGEANFLLFRAPVPLLEPLRKQGILLRGCANFRGLGPQWYRAAVRRPGGKPVPAGGNKNRSGGDEDMRRRAKCVMVQGTMSGVGKSLLCAALCRIFAQDGWRVAPFKSQNMALNSCVTAEGLEMGRAQAVQAAPRCGAGCAHESDPS